jgi:PTH1 family peptidyl-tRNA hydrolase
VARYLICGLGNPGADYEQTRHNIGWMALDAVADRHRIRMSSDKFHGDFGDGRLAGERAMLLRPTTFMNKSGQAVAECANFYDLPPDHVVVLHDDIDLDVGRLKVKAGGGHGGHNGLRDIVQRLGDDSFVRVRIGVGRPEHGDVTNYVLSRFDDDQWTTMERVIPAVADAVETIVDQGSRAAQNEVNGREFAD